MIFNSSLTELRDALKKTLPALAAKSTIPILEHLSFTLEGNNLKIVSTDQDITIMSMLEVDGEEDGSVLIPGKKLNDIIRVLGSDGEIKFKVDEENFDIKFVSGSDKYSMKGIEPGEYLELPELFQSNKPNFDGESIVNEIGSDEEAAFFKIDDLQTLANNTANSVSRDEFRPAMTGVLFQFRSEMVSAVSTDSFRLSKITVRSDKKNFPEELDIIIPVKTIEMVKLFDSDVLVSFIKSNSKVTHIRFDVGNTIYISRIIDEKFPPYESVIPTNNHLVAKVDKTLLLPAIKKVASCSNNISKQIKIKFANNNMTLVGKDDDTGTDAVVNMSCEYNNEEEIEMGFNHAYLEQAINNLIELENNTFYFTFSESTKSALLLSSLENTDILMLIMPVRIN